LEFFRKMEFNSLIWEEEKKLTKWNDLGLKVQIIWDKQGLNELLEKIKKYKNIVLDTETTSLDIIKAKLVWVSIFLDEKNIFYINLRHSWPKVNVDDLNDFLKKLFKLDITIIGHNIKYDLEIIDLFLNWEQEDIIWNNNQIQLDI
jgi:DNA polymerase-1